MQSTYKFLCNEIVDAESNRKVLPIKVLQIGDGNFIRAFLDWIFYELNNTANFQGGIVSIQSTSRGQGNRKLQQQNNLFTVLSRGLVDGEVSEQTTVIDTVQESINPYEDWPAVLKQMENPELQFIFSNTTEAGLQYTMEKWSTHTAQNSFPGKLVQLLFHRFTFFNGEIERGLYILPLELVEENGQKLQQICMQIAQDWALSSEFKKWMTDSCFFCNTLVDRIVPGFPEESADLFQRYGYKDELLTICEPYHLFVIEGPEKLQQLLPYKEANLNIKFEDIKKYRELKVKILNGIHTILASQGLLMDLHTVKEAIEHPVIKPFITQIVEDELFGHLHREEKEQTLAYMNIVFERFQNPFIHHKLADIRLNSFSKLKTRIWPSIEQYIEINNKLPKNLMFAMTIALFGLDSQRFTVRDSEENIAILSAFQREMLTERKLTVMGDFLDKEFGCPPLQLADMAFQMVSYWENLEQNDLQTLLLKTKGDVKL